MALPDGTFPGIPPSVVPAGNDPASPALQAGTNPFQLQNHGGSGGSRNPVLLASNKASTMIADTQSQA